MIDSIYVSIFLSAFAGFLCGILLTLGKHIGWIYKKPHIDIIFSIIRFIIFISFIYSILQFNQSNLILLLVVFLGSYINTTIMITHKKL